MRLYTLTNFYMSSIQHGIQSAHIVSELFNKYTERELRIDYQLYDWSLNHKTIVVLNGGAYQDVLDWFEFLNQPQNPFPSAGFFEDVYSLNGMLTIAGVVLPAYIYDVAEMIRFRTASLVSHPLDSGLWVPATPDNALVNDHDYTEWEVELITRLNKCGLAK